MPQGLTILVTLTESLEVIWQSSSNMLFSQMLQLDPISKAAQPYHVRKMRIIYKLIPSLRLASMQPRSNKLWTVKLCNYKTKLHLLGTK